MHIIAHHSGDNDGYCSGSIVRHNLMRQGVIEQDIRMIGVDYGQDYSWIGNITPEDHMYVTDFCFEPFHHMWTIKSRAKSMVWIDHHRSAIDEAEKQGFATMGTLKVGYSATELAWDYFMGTPPPPVVHHLGRYDVFDKSDPRSELIELFYRTQAWTCPEHPHSAVEWMRTFDITEAGLDETVEKGKLLMAYRDSENARTAKRAVTIQFEGLSVISLNSCGKGSAVFDSVFNPEVHDAMLTWSIAPGVNPTVSIGMYGGIESKHDLSKIAVKHGGGGHPGACGFKMPLQNFLRFVMLGEPEPDVPVFGYSQSS